MQMSHEDFLEHMNVEIPLILGGTPSGGVLLLTMSRIHARMFFFKTLSQSNTDDAKYVLLVHQLGHIIDTSIEAALVKMCAAFEKSNDFTAAHRALLLLTQGCKDVAMCMKSIFDRHEFSNTKGFHSFLQSAHTLAPMHQEVERECVSMTSKEMVAAYRKLAMTCLLSTSKRVPENSLLKLIMSSDDLRTCVLWKEQAFVMRCFHRKSRLEMPDLVNIMVAADIPRFFWPM